MARNRRLGRIAVSILSGRGIARRTGRTPGTDELTKSVIGFRYLVNEPGEGVTVRDVGRITYGDLEQTIVAWQAGKHDLALDAQFQPTFCAALA